MNQDQAASLFQTQNDIYRVMVRLAKYHSDAAERRRGQRAPAEAEGTGVCSNGWKVEDA